MVQNRRMTQKSPRWQRLAEQITIAFVAGCCGAVLYMALFPAFYYMQWLFMILLLGIVTLGSLGVYTLILVLSRREATGTSARPQFHGVGFTLGMLAIVVLLVGFKVPLHASFLWARPGLEQALAENQDDLGEIGVYSYDYGLYPIGSAARDCHHNDRVYFRFHGDSESAIIYSESGLDDLCYNSGNKGHLSGNWYWMKED